MKNRSASNKNFWVLILAFVLLAGYSSNALATQYSTAPEYAPASHGSPLWQQLGSSPTVNDGVTWSINGGAYGNATLAAGELVTFKFDMYKKEWGIHAYDAIKVWIDWNNDKDFTDTGEMILSDKWNLWTDSRNPNPRGDSSANLLTSFYTTFVIPANATGEFWLRARVACSESIGDGAGTGNMSGLTPTGYLSQGEVEDWKLTVSPVPEPSTILLLGLGLGGVAIMRRRLKK